MQSSLTYRTNRDLFSNYYLDEHLPETEEWDEVDDDELEAAYDEIVDLYDREKSTAPKRNESQLEEKFIRPMFRKLGIPFEVEESTSRTQRRPDYGFFETEDAARDAFERREGGGDFYENAVAVADAKRWGRPLDTRGSGEHERDFENPSYQIHVYLQETPARWAVLTDGKKWRLYYGPTSHRLDSYYEVDLPTVLEKGDLEDFKYFYLFFRHDAFLEDSGGDCFLDDVYDESNVFAQDLGEDLQDNIYEAIKILSEGYLQYPDNDLDEDDLDLVHDSSLIYLYRLIFVLYAEAEGRDLLDTDNEIYEESYSLNSLKQEIAEELDSGDPKYRDWQDDLSSRLDELFELIDQGSKSRGIPEEDLHIPAYNGGLFRTDPDEDDSAEARFLAEHTVGDAYLARVVELLTRSQQVSGGGKIFVDYSSLDVRHLGSIYEGLLEYQLHVADEPLTVDDGEYVEANEGDGVFIETGEVYLTTGSGERKATGSYYTPEYVVEYIVDETLGPLVDDIREDLVGQTTYRKGDDEAGTFAEEFAERIFELKILDPAMGSGHFLTSAVDYLAREIIDAQERQAAQQGIETVEEDHDINWARRKVAQRCIYGVDLNPLATELAKVSLWLRTLAAEQPLAFLDHHLKTGNSLVGSDIEDVLANRDNSETGDGQLTLQQSFAHTRQRALEHVMNRFQDLLSIDNETLEDAKEMEDVYDEVRDDSLYQHLLAMANVHTAAQFGLDVPSDADKRMAEALRSDSWTDIEGQDWFVDAQTMASEERFFHWELEFPVAFYDADGDRREDAGFDAVIGNPPYISVTNLDPKLRQYLTDTEEYRTATGRYDAYIVFFEKSIELSRPGGLTSMIIPIKWAIYGNGRVLRDMLLEEVSLESLINISQAEVFDGPTTYPCIPVVTNQTPAPDQEVSVINIPPDNPEYISQGLESLLSTELAVRIPLERFKLAPRKVFCPFLNDRNWQIHSKLHENSTEVGDKYRLEQAIRMGSASAREKLFTNSPPENKRDNYHPVVDGEHIERFTVNWDGRYLKYDPDELYNAKSKELLDQPKILLKRIAERLTAAYDGGVDGDYYYPLNTVYTLTKEQGTIEDQETHPLFETGLLNSTLLDWEYKLLFAAIGIRGGYIEFREYIDHLPLKNISFTSTEDERSELVDEYWKTVIDRIESANFDAASTAESVFESESPEEIAHDLIVKAVDKIAERRQEANQINVDLTDYINDYEQTTSVKDIPGYQPAPDRGATILSKTTESVEGLRVGSAAVQKKQGKTIVQLTARYKPNDEEDYETDQWGYTETEPITVAEYIGLTKKQEALVSEFIPYAVEEAGGFAGFRSNATKTNSLIARFEQMEIPALEDVENSLDLFLSNKQRYDRLVQGSDSLDSYVDHLIFRLYDLNEDEIELVMRGGVSG